MHLFNQMIILSAALGVMALPIAHPEVTKSDLLQQKAGYALQSVGQGLGAVGKGLEAYGKPSTKTAGSAAPSSPKSPAHTAPLIPAPAHPSRPPPPIPAPAHPSRSPPPIPAPAHPSRPPPPIPAPAHPTRPPPPIPGSAGAHASSHKKREAEPAPPVTGSELRAAGKVGNTGAKLAVKDSRKTATKVGKALEMADKATQSLAYTLQSAGHPSHKKRDVNSVKKKVESHLPKAITNMSPATKKKVVDGAKIAGQVALTAAPLLLLKQ
jgi:hypothetical protein